MHLRNFEKDGWMDGWVDEKGKFVVLFKVLVKKLKNVQVCITGMDLCLFLSDYTHRERTRGPHLH